MWIWYLLLIVIIIVGVVYYWRNIRPEINTRCNLFLLGKETEMDTAPCFESQTEKVKIVHLTSSTNTEYCVNI